MRNGVGVGRVSVDLKGRKVKGKLSIASSIGEENHDVLLHIETREQDGSFVNRLLSREEGTGHSSRSYYGAPVQGRVPFDWEAEPGKPKTGVRKEGESGHGIPPLSPPPILQAKNAHNQSASSSRRKVGFFQKIKDFMQCKTLAKPPKPGQRRSRPIVGDLFRHSEKGKDKMRSNSVGYHRTSQESGGSDWEIYGIEGDCDFIPFRYSVS